MSINRNFRFTRRSGDAWIILYSRESSNWHDLLTRRHPASGINYLRRGKMRGPHLANIGILFGAYMLLLILFISNFSAREAKRLAFIRLWGGVQFLYLF